jgi:hypothetical protein
MGSAEIIHKCFHLEDASSAKILNSLKPVEAKLKLRRVEIARLVEEVRKKG